MKCKNCGADYASRALCCPYCDTPNPRGILWHRQRTQVDARYEKGLELLPLLRRVAVNRLLNRVLAVELALCLLFVAGVFAVFGLTDLAGQTGVMLRRGALQAELDMLYQEGRYAELYRLLDDTGLFGEDQYEYSQMALLYYDYEQFCQSRLTYYAETDMGEPDDYTLESLIRDMHDVLHPDIPAYPDMTERNAAQQAAYARDVRAFAQSVLCLTEEEMALFDRDYLYTDQTALLARAAQERGHAE